MADKGFKEALGILTESGVFQETDFPLQNRSLESRVRRGELQVVAQNADGSTEAVETDLVVWVDGRPEKFDRENERHTEEKRRNGSIVPSELFEDIEDQGGSPSEPPTREKNAKGGKKKGQKNAESEENEGE